MTLKTVFAATAASVTLALATPALADHHKSGEKAEHSEAHEALKMAVKSDKRGEANMSRDVWRHPMKTLKFFKVEPGMTVVDMFPGGAYYTDILVPYLGAEGSYIGALSTVPGASEEGAARQRAFPENFTKGVAEAHAKSGITGAPVTGYNFETLPEGIEGTVDRVLVIRMMHNFHRWDMAHDQLTKYRTMLKDDGMLGIVQHRAKADAPYSYADGNNGYMRQEDVIKLVEAHGFDLVATSEINANPNDTADHEGGVWQIPPIWASKDEAKKAIGESDRMTLLFKKRP